MVLIAVCLGCNNKDTAPSGSAGSGMQPVAISPGSGSAAAGSGSAAPAPPAGSADPATAPPAASGSAIAAAGDPGAPKSAGQPLGDDVMNQETIGGIKIGSSQTDVVKVLGEPKRRTKAQREEATGNTVTTWKWPGVDIVLTKTGKQLRVASIHIAAPSTLATSRGIHIGSARAEVQAGYRRAEDPTEDQNSYLVGSEYGGELFSFKNGKVVEIFVGAMAF